MYWVLAAIAFGCLIVLMIYNNLISHRNQAESAFSTIDVMLKKRLDLIPNLVAVAKGYMRHEAALLERVSALRSAALANPVQSEERMEAEGQLSSALHQFQLRVEDYPELKASEQFLQLQAALNECEEQISAARRAFNASILQYNNGVEMFPGSVIAELFKFKRRAFYKIAEPQRTNP